MITAAVDQAARSARFIEARRMALALLERDVDFIQDPDTGRMEGSHPQGGDSGGGGSDSKPGESTSSSSSSGGGEKKKAEIADFAKDEVQLDEATRVDSETQKKFIDTWNTHVGAAPADFRKEFLGGVKGTMGIRYKDKENAMTMSGAVLDADGNKIGDYTRTVDFDDKKASSDYFKLNNSATGKAVGKQVLAANVAMYQKMGLESVEVHADIDVGGYAWAKYGYVPTRSSWSSLSDDIMSEIDKLSSGTGYEADSWESVPSHDQRQIESAWKDATHDEFLDSEIENWRDNGEPLEDAKKGLVDQFNNGEEQSWAEHAIDGYRKSLTDAGKKDIPFSNDTLIEALTLDFKSRYGDGRGDLDVTFNDDKLTSPSGVDPAQGTLPGLPTVEPHEYLTSDMRDGLTKALDKAFDGEADSKAADAEPPSWIADSVSEMQGEYWDQMDDDTKFEWAQNNASEHLTSGEEGTGELDEEDANRLRMLAASSDPKAVWAIADSQWGKELLLGQDWYGVMNLKDKETMDRFNAYVGAKKAA
jgi:hypothetical protein